MLAPLAGNQYHGGYAVNGPDSYPNGDPTGAGTPACIVEGAVGWGPGADSLRS